MPDIERISGCFGLFYKLFFNFFLNRRVTFLPIHVLTSALRPEKLRAGKEKSLFNNKKHYQMKTLAENLENLVVLNEQEMNSILGGTYTCTGVEDEECWL